jgi:hypothetical protein
MVGFILTCGIHLLSGSSKLEVDHDLELLGDLFKIKMSKCAIRNSV